jgi:phosphatidylserine decarboxylase
MRQFTWADPPGYTAYPIARPGYPFIGAAAFATAVFALLGLTAASLVGLLATGAICAFFRDPDRVIPTDSGAVVSPADGKVILCEPVADSDFYSGPALKISIFMTVFDVHVNRVCREGSVQKVAYFPGKFFSANLDKASRENEHNAVYLETAAGQRVTIVQIAGLIARRIICRVQAGDAVQRGQRFGMICFGSRLDVYLPADTRPAVARGDKVRAGASVLGYLA